MDTNYPSDASRYRPPPPMEGPQSIDHWHVDVREPWEIYFWTRQLDCTEAELRAAVARVGNVAGDVRIHLERSC